MVVTMAFRLPLWRPLLGGVLLALTLAGGTALAEEAPRIPEEVRLVQIRSIAKQLRKRARSPRAAEHKEEVMRLLGALDTLGGHEAAAAALDAVPIPDRDVRDHVFALVDREHHGALLKPLIGLLADRDHRRDGDLQRRVARSLSVLGDPAAVEPLAEWVRTDTDAHVVAAVADSLATFGSAPLSTRKEAVRRLLDVYEATWNLMMSIRPEDRVISSVMEERWGIYHRAVLSALQALTGQTLTRPQEWRAWWNAHKKRTDW
jgi:hypothetical protein